MKFLCILAMLATPIAAHADDDGGIVAAVAGAIASAMDVSGGDDD